MRGVLPALFVWESSNDVPTWTGIKRKTVSANKNASFSHFGPSKMVSRNYIHGDLPTQLYQIPAEGVKRTSYGDKCVQMRDEVPTFRQQVHSQVLELHFRRQKGLQTDCSVPSYLSRSLTMLAGASLYTCFTKHSEHDFGDRMALCQRKRARLRY